MITMMGQFAEHLRNLFKGKTFIKVRWSKPLNNNRIGKTSEIDPSSFWQGAEQEQNLQNY